MITREQYFRGRKHTEEQKINASTLLSRVSGLLCEYERQTGNVLEKNPRTASLIAGVTEGGFRFPDCTQGAAMSSHKEAKGVDVYDPFNAIDNWLNDDLLEQFDLYREHPEDTNHWCHLTTRPPKSKKRTFKP